jgi:hypothetical protein
LEGDLDGALVVTTGTLDGSLVMNGHLLGVWDGLEVVGCSKIFDCEKESLVVERSNDSWKVSLKDLSSSVFYLLGIGKVAMQ